MQGAQLPFVLTLCSSVVTVRVMDKSIQREARGGLQRVEEFFSSLFRVLFLLLILLKADSRQLRAASQLTIHKFSSHSVTIVLRGIFRNTGRNTFSDLGEEELCASDF